MNFNIHSFENFKFYLLYIFFGYKTVVFGYKTVLR